MRRPGSSDDVESLYCGRREACGRRLNDQDETFCAVQYLRHPSGFGFAETRQRNTLSRQRLDDFTRSASSNAGAAATVKFLEQSLGRRNVHFRGALDRRWGFLARFVTPGLPRVSAIPARDLARASFYFHRPQNPETTIRSIPPTIQRQKCCLYLAVAP